MLLTMRMRHLLLTAAVVLGVAPAAHAASHTTTSTNWAGYAVQGSGVKFHKVSGSWTVPTVDCSSGRGWSANWVGLGGFADTSQALEQLGTEADCGGDGSASYSSWYELVPSVSHGVHRTTRPGDKFSASVTVTGRKVRLRMTDVTRGWTFSKTLTAKALDLTSAEWIVEAPAACASADTSRCEVMPLADFGTTAFGSATATTVGGHTGTVADPAWNAIAIDLATDSRFADGPWGYGRGGYGGYGRRPSTGATAQTGSLSSTGTAFNVTWSDSSSTDASTPTVSTPPTS